LPLGQLWEERGWKRHFFLEEAGRKEKLERKASLRDEEKKKKKDKKSSLKK